MSAESSLFLSTERRRILKTAGAWLFSCSLGIGHAQTTWPNKPIRLVLPSGLVGWGRHFGSPPGGMAK